LRRRRAAYDAAAVGISGAAPGDERADECATADAAADSGTANAVDLPTDMLLSLAAELGEAVLGAGVVVGMTGALKAVRRHECDSSDDARALVYASPLTAAPQMNLVQTPTHTRTVPLWQAQKGHHIALAAANAHLP
jgi:hypothetical protein